MFSCGLYRYEEKDVIMTSSFYGDVSSEAKQILHMGDYYIFLICADSSTGNNKKSKQDQGDQGQSPGLRF